MKVPYTNIPNEILNIGLSSGAVHLAVYMYSNSEKWEYHNHSVCKKLDISERTLSKYWKELMDHNVISRTRKCINGFANGGFDYEILMTVQNDVLHERNICGDAVIEPKIKKSKNETILNDEQSDHFDYIWKNYELIGIVQIAGRTNENKSNIKKMFKSLVDNKISPKIIEDYVFNHYDDCADKKYLKGLRSLFSDKDTLKELQEKYDENNK